MMFTYVIQVPRKNIPDNVSRLNSNHFRRLMLYIIPIIYVLAKRDGGHPDG